MASLPFYSPGDMLLDLENTVYLTAKEIRPRVASDHTATKGRASTWSTVSGCLTSMMCNALGPRVSTGRDFALPGDISQFLETFLVVRLQGGYWWVVARDAAGHPVMHKTASLAS